MTPFSCRTMSGTSLPSVVLVVAMSVGTRGLGVERFPFAALVAIEILDHRRRGAGGVGGRRQAVRLVLADERLLLRAREQGAVHGMIDEGEGRLLAAGLDDQPVGAVLQPLDQADPAAFRIRPEGARHIVGADRHFRRGLSAGNPHQRVAAGHERRAATTATSMPKTVGPPACAHADPASAPQTTAKDAVRRVIFRTICSSLSLRFYFVGSQIDPEAPAKQRPKCDHAVLIPSDLMLRSRAQHGVSKHGREHGIRNFRANAHACGHPSRRRLRRLLRTRSKDWTSRRTGGKCLGQEEPP